ncbi:MULTISPECIES: SDR family NAD(P)-dependent oxidoreductase [unclassified Crossiella]|uniref:SDR family NAD(P)-dependent oxidoreductase n=1 Tax=unclassified Crossiella TaxID=2620835 RepID=UPI001FFFFFDC|nr:MULTISPECIES: SDR family NAD(P)-dependent oxidoreductase [unclassified Crossiella]MCK2241729.1 SDR family NAD(P)-dependent oxidoreductase [Crossiella sp. S99.2]MCK2255399.1 SDR family NAD(P)-dependent oxidoreductase [Crossiella sp. S99.1]
MQANDVALVTGANKGIGREIVRQLALQGYTVYLGARDAERGQAAVAELVAQQGESGGDIRVVRLDVTDADSVRAAVDRIEDQVGRLDVLVNNAGIVVEWGVRTEQVTAAQLREVFEVNVFGVVTVTAACVPLLRRSGNPRIVNMSSGLGSLGLLSDPASPFSAKDLLAYSASKAALNALTLGYADALRADGFKVNATSPGLVRTDGNAAATFPRGDRGPAEGAVVPVGLATLPADGPTGVFRGPEALDQTIPW